MREDEHRASQIKHAVYAARRNGGKGFVISRMNHKVKAMVEQNFTVEEYYYEVGLQFPPYFKPSRNTPYVVKDMYFYKKKHRGVKTRKVHLSPSKVQACRAFGMPV